jgi:hypothetical protein
MNRGEFTNHIAISDAQKSRFAFIFSVLRIAADDRAVADVVVCTQLDISQNHRVCFDPRSITDDRVAFHHHKRPDAHVRTELGL